MSPSVPATHSIAPCFRSRAVYLPARYHLLFVRYAYQVNSLIIQDKSFLLEADSSSRLNSLYSKIRFSVFSVDNRASARPLPATEEVSTDADA